MRLSEVPEDVILRAKEKVEEFAQANCKGDAELKALLVEKALPLFIELENLAVESVFYPHRRPEGSSLAALAQTRQLLADLANEELGILNT